MAIQSNEVVSAALQILGYDLGAGGYLLRDAVKDFQRKNGLKEDGIVGEFTGAALIHAIQMARAQPTANPPPHPILPAPPPLPAPAPAASGRVVLEKQAWPSQYRPAVTQFYGDPGQGNDADPHWKAVNLVHMPTVFPMIWDLDGAGRGKPVPHLIVHKRVVPSLARCFHAILEAYPDRAQLEAHHLHWWGGCYNWRKMRGGKLMSMHALGAAIDYAPTWNAQHKMWHDDSEMLPMRVVQIFESEGWTWGGRWSPKSVDPMHLQSAHL